MLSRRFDMIIVRSNILNMLWKLEQPLILLSPKNQKRFVSRQTLSTLSTTKIQPNVSLEMCRKN